MAFVIGPKSALYPFRELFGRIPDAKIAEMADCSVATVETYRRKLGLSEGAEDLPPEADDVHQDEQAVPQALDDIDEEPRAAIVPVVEEDVPAAAAEPEREPAPRLVRVVRTAWVQRFPPVGQPRRIGRADVYRDEQAAWLWEHHRDLVEAFEPKG